MNMSDQVTLVCSLVHDTNNKYINVFKAGLEEKKNRGGEFFSEKIRGAKTFFNYKKKGENFFQLNKGERRLLFEKK